MMFLNQIKLRYLLLIMSILLLISCGGVNEGSAIATGGGSTETPFGTLSANCGTQSCL